MKTVINVAHAPAQHWVGDGFPVRSMFNYQEGAEAFSPFLCWTTPRPPALVRTHHRTIGAVWARTRIAVLKP